MGCLLSAFSVGISCCFFHFVNTYLRTPLANTLQVLQYGQDFRFPVAQSSYKMTGYTLDLTLHYHDFPFHNGHFSTACHYSLTPSAYPFLKTLFCYSFLNLSCICTTPIR